MAEHFIKVIDNVLPEELCQGFIQQMKNSQNLSPGQTGGGVDLDRKRSMDVSIHLPEFSTLYQQTLPLITEHIFSYFKEYFFALIGPIGLTLKHPKTGEPVKVTAENFDEIAAGNLPNLVKYLFRIGEINAQQYKSGNGGYPYWHSEVYPQLPNNDALHRILLFMFYLNDVEEGGETDFYYQEVSVKPKAGRMVIAPAYFTHTHRGNIPISDDKYILTSWVLFNPAQQIYT